MQIDAPTTEAALDAMLSAPCALVRNTLAQLDGDLLILGAGGKMGPSLCVMARRALADIGARSRAVIAVSRFTDGSLSQYLRDAGVQVIPTDLTDPAAVRALPRAPNVLFLAGQKFGSHGSPLQTWAMNAVVPQYCAEHAERARQVVFSTGNVYPLTPRAGPGASESTPPAPIGEYAMSCLARERVSAAIAQRHQAPMVLYRLNYACALRYGVLTDLAVAVRDGTPIDRRMGAVNVIWQRDANAAALALLLHGGTPAVPVNVTGVSTESVQSLAERLGAAMGRQPVFEGEPADDALLSDAAALASLLGSAWRPMAIDRLVELTAHWVANHGSLLGKPTKFQVRDGRF
jgi:hypothetical protein